MLDGDIDAMVAVEISGRQHRGIRRSREVDGSRQSGRRVTQQVAGPALRRGQSALVGRQHVVEAVSLEIGRDERPGIAIDRDRAGVGEGAVAAAQQSADAAARPVRCCNVRWGPQPQAITTARRAVRMSSYWINCNRARQVRRFGASPADSRDRRSHDPAVATAGGAPIHEISSGEDRGGTRLRNRTRLCTGERLRCRRRSS